MRVLLVEDDGLIADALRRSFRQAGYAVDHENSGTQADAALGVQAYDLVVLDLGLPGLSGFEVLSRLRSRKSAVPVLILTARDAVEDRVRGLDAGADDYLTKPFALPELQARVRALTRRGTGQGSAVVLGPLCYDQSHRSATMNDEPLELSAREAALLEVLLLRPGKLVNKSYLVDHLCSWGEEVSLNAIEVYVHRLRKKLESGGLRIATVRGLGYCLEIPSAHRLVPVSQSAELWVSV